MYDKYKLNFGESISVGGGPMLAGQGVRSDESIGFAGTPDRDVMSGDLSSTGTYPSVTMDEDEQKEDEEMSFAGIMYNDNGVVVFSDSRSTQPTIDNEKRFIDDDTTKVFKSERFIFVTWNNNEYRINNVPHPVAELFNELLDGFHGTHREFTEIVSKELKDTFFAIPNAEYDFLFGFKENIDDKIYYGMEECIITRPGIQFKNLDYSFGYRCGGFTNYAPRSIAVARVWSVKEMEERCKTLVDSVIRLGDAFMVYNPVGGRVQTEVLT